MYWCSDNPKPHLLIIDPGVTPDTEVAYPVTSYDLGLFATVLQCLYLDNVSSSNRIQTNSKGLKITESRSALSDSLWLNNNKLDVIRNAFLEHLQYTHEERVIWERKRRSLEGQSILKACKEKEVWRNGNQS